MDSANKTSDAQQFTVTYKGGKLQAVQENIASDIEVSLLLIGTEFFNEDMAYSAVAEAIFCVPRNDYFFRILYYLKNFVNFCCNFSVQMEYFKYSERFRRKFEKCSRRIINAIQRITKIWFILCSFCCIIFE